jgi:hypothetical protein
MAGLPFGIACTPSCDVVCEKVVECENEGTERMSSAECAESCTDQRDLYAGWTDVQKRDAFDEELTCLYESSCADIAEDICYDEMIWSF